MSDIIARGMANAIGRIPNTQTWIATEGQTVFTLGNGSYIPNKNLLTVSIGSVLQISGENYVETNSTSFTLTTPLPAGTKVYAKWYEVKVPETVGHGTRHEFGGSDEIDVTKLKNYNVIGEQLAEKAKQHWVDVSKFGYDLNAVKAAIATLKDGDTLYFPNTGTTYLLLGEAITIPVPNITLRGTGLIKVDYGFRPSASGFTADGLRMESNGYSSNAKAIRVDIPPSGTFLKNLAVRNCSFKNFFYSVSFIGGDYQVTGNEATEGFPIRDVVIENCYSETYSNQNAGHFQCIQVENISYINNSCYGGQNATSYNAIKGNGYIKVIGNYDDNNSYGSCEIENASGKVIVSGNTFKKKIWIDDSFSAIVDGNYTDDIIHITVGSNNGDADNIVISNNIARVIRAESFGTYLGGKIKNLLISDNVLNSPNANSYGIWVHGTYTEFALVDNNLISGTYTSGKIGIVRGTGCEILLRQNIVKGSVVITSTGGLVYKDSNLGATYTGTTDTLTY